MRIAPVVLAGALALAGCGKSDKPAADTAEAPSGAPEATVEPTAAMGAEVFKRCVACHTIDKDGANGIGPNLHGVVGRAVASHAGFSYSSAMKAKGGVWDDAALDIYLKQPMMAVPGTRMAFAGIPDDLDRKALILYLDEQK
ncbi:MAG: c-type cytochrome [Sphingopyxis sp.]|jgi:cytochrome c|uniref:c-type cytochrome n=1 Tax=Sphingopyxis sp. TaxID=1908224 RepID=UPI003D6C7215